MIEDGVRVVGNVKIGICPCIGAPAELTARRSELVIGNYFDCAAFVTISTLDSHLRCLGCSSTVEAKDIIIGDHVFIGTGAVILGGCEIGDYCVIGAGVVLKNAKLPPYTRVRAPAPIIEPGYYERKITGRTA